MIDPFVLVHDSGVFYRATGSSPLTSELHAARQFIDEGQAVMVCGALNDYRVDGDQFSVRPVSACAEVFA